ncbi:hypothetical protein QQ045_004702 [Rhodiola kirilowii]
MCESLNEASRSLGIIAVLVAHCRPPDPNGYPVLNATSPPPPPANVWTVEGRSFSNVAKTKPSSRFPPIQLASRQYGSKDGKPSISFTPAELQVGVDYLKFSLMAKFSGGRPPIEDIRKAFSTAWTLIGQCSIGAWDARHILIVLDTEQDARRVLVHPMRKLGHSLFRVFRWMKDFSTRREPTTTMAWIRLASLPPELYNQGYIESIVSSFGRFLAMDSRTVCFINSNFARTSPMEFEFQQASTAVLWQEIVYENRLHYCSKCKLHRHLLMNCRKVKQKQDMERNVQVAHADPTPKSPISTPKEVSNVLFVVKNGFGKFSKSPKEIASIVQQWFGPMQDELQAMSQNALRVAKPDAVFRIVNNLLDLVKKRNLAIQAA